MSKDKIVVIDEDLHRRVKIRASENVTSVKEFVSEAIETKLEGVNNE